MAVAASFTALFAMACTDAVDPMSPIHSSALSSSSSVASADFAVLANAAVSCTDGSITGSVGTLQGAPPGAFNDINCEVDGSIHLGDGFAEQAYEDFLAEYAALAEVECDEVLTGTLNDVTLTPGVYCFEAAAAVTGTLTLDGSSSDTWLFKVGTSGTGALTGTNFEVVLDGDVEECNVTWWVAEAATMTDSDFIGSILAGAAITLTRGTFHGNAWAGAAGVGDVTITGTAVTGCEAGVPEEPEEPEAEGCTPGYWKNHHGSWEPTGFSPDQTVGSVFTGASATNAAATLNKALAFPGGPRVEGGQRILLRAAVASLLNAAHPDVNFGLTVAEVISKVDAALASDNRQEMLDLAEELDALNNAGCPLDGGPPPDERGKGKGKSGR
ncbi:MAG: ice-binding family protein [Gemmatimonadota bacterium]